MAVRHEEVVLVPILSRGRHNSPRRGACFMEYASYLAGVSWSDHPDCTHPLLALVGREVNDEISDAARVELVPMIPSVIGLIPTDPRFVPALVTRCVQPVLPVVSPQFQRTLTRGLVRAQQVLADLEAPTSSLRASCYASEAPLVIAGTIRAVIDFRAPDGDRLLLRLLSDAIEEARSWVAVSDSTLPSTASAAGRR
jgi:hypothetical protein